MVQTRLTQMFGFAPEVAVNVDERCAWRRVHAGLTVLRDNSSEVPVGVAGGLRDVKLKDVCNHSYGTICARLMRKPASEFRKLYHSEEKYSVAVRRIAHLLYRFRQSEELQAMITQGEDTNPEYVNRIATEIFELPPGRSANRPVRVTYSYDVNQRMHCKFEDLDSSRVLEVNLSIDKDGRCTQKEAEQKACELAAFQVE